MELRRTGELNRVIASAEKDAEKMHVRINTALILRSMLKNAGPCCDVLSKLGLTYDIYESGLRSLPLYREAVNAPQLVYERAQRIALCASSRELTSIQVLLAMLEEPCMCQALLRGLRVDLNAMRKVLYTYTMPFDGEKQYIQVRSSSTASMNAVAVQNRSVHSTSTTFIAPQPAACFGTDESNESPQNVAYPGAKPSRRLLTPHEIARLSGQAASESGERQAIKSNKDCLSSSSCYESVSRRSSEYASAPSREIQQSTTRELALRLLEKKTQSTVMKAQKGSVEKDSTLPDSSVLSSSSVDDKIALRDDGDETPKKESVEASVEPKAEGASSKVVTTESNGADANRMLNAALNPQTPTAKSATTAVSRANSKGMRALNYMGTVCARKTEAKTAGYHSLELSPRQFPTLCQFGRNLLQEAKDGRLDPVIDRDEEINQLIDVINKRRCNNPILIGEPGVGKTAIVEGLAMKMFRHEVPETMEGRTIIALDYGAMISGTQLRGAVQDRFKAIKEEVKKADGRIILFLDDIHIWLGNGSNDPNADAAYELKMALTRGDLLCIGTSTQQDIRRAFNMNTAFERRFDMIEVKEPSAKTALKIIENGIILKYALHHDVRYDSGAIREAIRLSERYIQERALPDKAISVLDRAGSLCERSGDKVVTSVHVAQVISQIAEIPLERLIMTERQKLMNMEEILGERLIGHEAIIHKISNVIRRNHAGFCGKRPIGSFLFLGPTGVGKTETAKVLAEFLFGSSKNIVRFDMSEFMEQHSVAKLIGAPAGYVGFDDGGLLTEALRKRPYQIVLFDEIEKSHPDVWNILLQILDEGRLTDAKGRHVDFSNAVIIMTSNLGAQNFANAMQGSIGFANGEMPSPEETESLILRSARSHFSPELWNRIEEKLVFHPLNMQQVERIAHLLLWDSANRLKTDRGISLSFDETALIPFLLNNGGFKPSYGARPMRQTIQTYVESKVADWIIANICNDEHPEELFVGVRDKEIYVEEIQPL